MPRLLTFGDSYVFGDALPDGWPLIPNSLPSNYAWPKLLANNLGYESINLAKGGSGNTEILWRILNTTFLDDDLVIVGWSPHFDRSSFFEFVDGNTTRRIVEKNRRYKDIILSMGDPISNSSVMYRGHINYDIIIKNYLTIQHSSLYLKNKKIRFYNLLTFKDPANIIEIPNSLNIPFVDIDKALDKSHPGVESHALLASLIFNKVDANGLY